MAEFKVRKLDFSEYHPLDHWLVFCWDYPGGWRRHLSYRWQYQWSERLKSWTLCRAGRHEWVTWHGRDGSKSDGCANCFKDR